MYQNDHIIITETCSNMRTVARQALAGKWKDAVIAYIIFNICVFLPFYILNEIFGESIREMLVRIDPYVYSPGVMNTPMYNMSYSNLGNIYILLVIGAFVFGLSAFFLALFRNKKYESAQLFTGFEHFVKALGLMFMMILFTFLWTLLFVVPGIIAILRYSQAFFILVDDPSKGVMQCINESKAMMHGNKGKLFLLQLSFIGWAILSYIAGSIVASPFTMIFFASPIAMIISNLITGLAMCAVYAYSETASVAFYEILKGNLRAQTFSPGQYSAPSGATWADPQQQASGQPGPQSNGQQAPQGNGQQAQAPEIPGTTDPNSVNHNE